MRTTEEVDESLRVQTRRHAARKSILRAIAELRKDDEEEADRVVEQIAEG